MRRGGRPLPQGGATSACVVLHSVVCARPWLLGRRPFVHPSSRSSQSSAHGTGASQCLCCPHCIMRPTPQPFPPTPNPIARPAHRSAPSTSCAGTAWATALYASRCSPTRRRTSPQGESAAGGVPGRQHRRRSPRVTVLSQVPAHGLSSQLCSRLPPPTPRRRPPHPPHAGASTTRTPTTTSACPC